MKRINTAAMFLVAGFMTAEAAGQSSSMLRLPVGRLADSSAGTAAVARAAGGSVEAGRGSFTTLPPKEESRPATRAIEHVSLIAIPPVPPRKFKVNDLITIIVRQHKQYEAEAEYDKQKKWKFEGKLSDWFRFYGDVKHLGTDQLSNGDPGWKFDLKDKYEADGEIEREDRFTTRLQATIIDVKPNGNLMLEARTKEQHDEEAMDITLTGVCRSDDVSPDNTILSTQVAQLVLVEKNRGAVRDATQRGWVPRILDFLKPF